ncbi:MAG: DUF1574 domain-containing protein [Dysgonamonadaceae bacterium]|jgi:hypothetical protein|nr:DUF1574 domain-containing protein [Dysgonamonadaceae bacterium]
MMKRLLYKAFVFSIPIIAIVLFFEYYIRTRPSVYRSKRDNLIENADSVRILIMGNSHSTYGLNPNLFSEYAYNLAFEAQSIYFDKALIDKYLSILPNLKYLILEIDYGNLCQKRSENRDFFYKYYFDISYKGEHFVKEYLLQSVFVHSFKETWSLYWIDNKNGKVNPADAKGWTARSTHREDDVVGYDKNRIVAARFNESFKSFTGNEEELLLVEQAIETLKARGVNPVLITCPIYKSLRSLLDKDVTQKVAEEGRFLAEKFDIQYLNFFSDDSFEAADYFDSDHLNDSGAAKLTLKVDSLIENR